MEFSQGQSTASQQDEEMKSYEMLVEQSQQLSGTVTKQDFQMLSVIGKGAYGKVLLVKKKDPSG